MNVLVTGSNGQLGSEIKELHKECKSCNFFFKDFNEVDICNYDELKTFILKNKIDSVINCAAYTSVDQAENNKKIAKNVNSDGVHNIIKALKFVNGKLIHISTDYVFDGNHFLPYKENDDVNPIGIYGKTKRDGELAITGSNLDAIVIRTSWLYSNFGNNFVKTMLKAGKQKKNLNVIFDQIGTPTYARDLASICIKIISECNSSKISRNGKIYHYSNEGVASWFDFAQSIMELSNINCLIKPIQTKDYPTHAKRPYYSVLNKTKIKEDFNIEIPYWKDSLKDCLNKLKQ